MSEIEAEEPELRMAQLRADVVNKDADTAYKRSMSVSEPYKVFAAVIAAVATVVAAVFGVLGYILGRGH